MDRKIIKYLISENKIDFTKDKEVKFYNIFELSSIFIENNSYVYQIKENNNKFNIHKNTINLKDINEVNVCKLSFYSNEIVDLIYNDYYNFGFNIFSEIYISSVMKNKNIELLTYISNKIGNGFHILKYLISKENIYLIKDINFVNDLFSKFTNHCELIYNIYINKLLNLSTNFKIKYITNVIDNLLAKENNNYLLNNLIIEEYNRSYLNNINFVKYLIDKGFNIKENFSIASYMANLNINTFKLLYKAGAKIKGFNMKKENLKYLLKNYSFSQQKIQNMLDCYINCYEIEKFKIAIKYYDIYRDDNYLLHSLCQLYIYDFNIYNCNKDFLIEFLKVLFSYDINKKFINDKDLIFDLYKNNKYEIIKMIFSMF